MLDSVLYCVLGSKCSLLIVLGIFRWPLKGPFRCNLMQANLLTWAGSAG